MIRSLASLCGLFLLASNAWANTADMPGSDSSADACRPVYFSSLGALDKVLHVDEFRIHYTVSGSHGLETSADTDRNGTPDMIDDLALQLTTARNLYTQVMGLHHPLDQARYINAEYINIYVLALKSGNGMAFDEVVSERIRDRRMECGLRIFVDRRVSPSRNLTPAHELFHLYQYGYSMFKSSWYLEGMARWVESFFKANAPMVGVTEEDAPMTCNDAYRKTYTASNFWRQQAEKVRETGERAMPATLRAYRYSDGRAVIDAKQLHGAGFLLRALQALEYASSAAAKAQDLPLYHWPESLQKSKQFDNLICSAIEEVVVN